MLYEVITELGIASEDGRGIADFVEQRYRVITSYSIHYTKLYELLLCEDVPEGHRFHLRASKNLTETQIAHADFICSRFSGYGFPYPRQRKSSCFPGQKPLPGSCSRFCRITSYNVCYTKLLRERYSNMGDR